MSNRNRPKAGSVWSNDVASRRSPRRLASCGIYCSIRSSSWKRPSSNKRSVAQDVISFVFEKTRNMWSLRSGIFASLSAHPMHFTSTKSLPTSTAEENPERRFPSTYRCIASCAGRKSYPVAVTFMLSMIGLVLRSCARSVHAQRQTKTASDFDYRQHRHVPLIIVPASFNEKVGGRICHPQEYMYSRDSRLAGDRLQETLYFFLIFYCA